MRRSCTHLHELYIHSGRARLIPSASTTKGFESQSLGFLGLGGFGALLAVAFGAGVVAMGFTLVTVGVFPGKITTLEGVEGVVVDAVVDVMGGAIVGGGASCVAVGCDVLPSAPRRA